MSYIQKRRDNVLMLLTNGAYAVFFACHIYCTRYERIGMVTNQPTPGFLTNTTKLFGHIARAAASDHSRALRASTDRLPVDCRRPRGRPRQSWLRTIESDLRPLNLGLHSALRRATDRPSWRRIVETAMLFERAT